MEVILIKSFTNKAWRSPSTYMKIEDSLREKWPVTVLQEEDSQNLYLKLKELSENNNSNYFVFNIAEYVDEESKQGFIPEMLDDLNLQHLGSEAQVIELGLDKASAKKAFLENHVPTPDYFVVSENKDGLLQKANDVGYPLFVKPLAEGGHIGITEDSIVQDENHLEAAVDRVLDDHEQSALVESYIDNKCMREFSVGVLDGPTRLFLPIEIDFDAIKTGEEILSYNLAQNDLEEIKPVEDLETLEMINTMAGRAFDALGAKDYSRVDIRMNNTGCYVLEINTMPGLGPNSFLPQAGMDIFDWDYKDFIQQLVEISIES